MGMNCEFCADGYWRPAGTDPADPYGCRPCDCDPLGSTGVCLKEDAYGCEGYVIIFFSQCKSLNFLSESDRCKLIHFG